MRLRAIVLVAMAGSALALLSESPSASAAASAANVQLRAVRALLRQPEDQIDLAKTEVTVERMIDPSVDEAATLKQFDVWTSKARERFPQGDQTANDAKIAVLVSTLYQPGTWNDFRPFGYEFGDGVGIEVELMSHYLATRKGNCISMPVLFVILGQKLGLPVTLANAPGHVFVKYRRDDGEWMNFEATTGGAKSDASYEKELYITPKAIETGIYLRPLSRQESELVLIGTLLRAYGIKRPSEDILALADVMLDVDHNDIMALEMRTSVYRWDMHDQFAKKYPTPAQIPPSMQPAFMAIYRKHAAVMQQMNDLGWVPESPEHRAAYLQMIQQAKAKQQGGSQ